MAGQTTARLKHQFSAFDLALVSRKQTGIDLPKFNRLTGLEQVSYEAEDFNGFIPFGRGTLAFIKMVVMSKESRHPR